MEWGCPLPEFEMVRDFVRNMPWRNWEKKNTIQAYHKLAWQLERPTNEADHLYQLLKAMKTNKSLYPLLGELTTILCTPGPTATPEMKKKLATAINFHTSFQMCINHIPLWGLVDPGKEVELVRIKDNDRDVQEVVKITVPQVLFQHQVNHLPLWQPLL